VTTPLTDRENLRRVTLLLDALDQERQDEAGRRKEYAARIELLTTELLKVRDDIKHGQGSLFTDSSGAAGSGEGEARAAAAGVSAPRGSIVAALVSRSGRARRRRNPTKEKQWRPIPEMTTSSPR
jgi:hypothetical protein